MGGEPDPDPDDLLDADTRRRGRRLAVLSHPAGMTHRNVYTEQLPTLALVGLGAGEAMVGLQRFFEPLAQGLQLVALRGLARTSKRTMLLAGQSLACLAGLPLVAYGVLAEHGHGAAIAVASFAAASAGLAIANAVWFPLLRGYVEPGRIGAFFGVLRTGWHVALIAYFLAAQRWLEAHPGSFGLLFAVATLAGVVRIALVARLPEARGAAGERVRVRSTLALLRDEPRLRRYLAGMILYGGARRAAAPFAIVMMRRSLGLSDADVALTTAAFFAGGFASLYGWGRVVDRFGPRPVFQATALGSALLLGMLALAEQPSALGMVGFFFALAVLAAGFGVADTHVLFGLAPEREPTAVLVVADVSTSLAYGLAPLAAGLALDAAIAGGVEPGSAYAWLFAATALACLLSPLPVASFRR
jgi:predicted MFS family arabinose efflux permease